MLHTRNRPNPKPINQSYIPHCLVYLLTIQFDIAPFSVVAFGEVRRIDIGDTSELQDLNQTPRIVLGLKDEQARLDEFIQVTRLEALHLRRVFRYALFERDFGLFKDKLVSLNRIVNYCLVVVQVGKVQNHSPTVRYDQHALRIFSILVDIVAPDESCDSSSRGPCYGDVCGRKEVEIVVEQVEMGHCVITPPEIQILFFVLDCIQFGSNMQRTIAIGDKDSIPCMKWVDSLIWSQKSPVVEGATLRIVKTASKISE